MSSGIFRPASLMARIAPSPMVLLRAKIAVGLFELLRSSFVSMYPFLLLSAKTF